MTPPPGKVLPSDAPTAPHSAQLRKHRLILFQNPGHRSPPMRVLLAMPAACHPWRHSADLVTTPHP